MLAVVLNLVTRYAATVYTIDLSARGLEFLGYGVNPSAGTYRLLHDYPEPQRTHILDYMFSPNVGASYHRIKVSYCLPCVLVLSIFWRVSYSPHFIILPIYRSKLEGTAKARTGRRRHICESVGKETSHADTPGGFSRKLKRATQT